LFTDYEPGLIKLLPMPLHLIIDFLSGLLLATSPWLFGFDDQLYLPHLVLGLTEIVITLFSHSVPANEKFKDYPVSAASKRTKTRIRKSPWVTKAPRVHG
jgi:hypothetical protein